ncbi:MULTISPECIES: hypothetical protein [unclassified Mycobacterium]|uniref:hypothetical protein n=1 Tax=unclassified Mycobacterium TaxID=2642494 RepID=UPI0007FEF6F9|nr:MULTISPECIES: hypothetical protein [unclassified Mycobacterium]OBG56716.1 hypothetical protein A5703_06100 [Mycobacterium sp. E188]OBH33989.1 hypothetical protein A5691_09005 [Mycobacterium sp. E183]
MANLTRRAALAAFGALGAGGVLGLRYARRGIWPAGVRLTNCGGFMGAGHMDMNRYMDMFMRHSEISRVVEDIPGGVRTTTESTSPDLTAQLQAHVSSMYAHLDQGTEVGCMSQTLPTLFRRAGGYRRQLTFTPGGVIAEETADDPALTDVIRAHAREVTGFVEQGMPAMMQQMMGRGGMGCGRMMNPHMP